jgi:PAS domain S-box-containing protein
MRRLMVGTSLVMLAVLTGGIGYYRSEKRQVLSVAGRDLLAVSDLKLQALNSWRIDFLEEVLQMADDPTLKGAIAAPGDALPAARSNAIHSAMALYRRHQQYTAIRLLDADGRTLVSCTDRAGEATRLELLEARKAVESGRPGDLVIDAEGGVKHVCMAAPVRNVVEGHPEVVFAIVLESDPDLFLTPLIMSWPMSSESAETVLAQRTGDTVTLLSNVRFILPEELERGVPVAWTNVSYVMAALGRQGLVKAVDYRGVPVVAALASVPGTSWVMSTEMDVSEVFAGWRKQAPLIVVVVLLLAGGVCLVGLSAWQHDQKTAYARLYHAEVGLRASEARFRVVLSSIADAVIGVDRAGLVQVFNAQAEVLTGWSSAKAAGKPLSEVVRLACADDHSIPECPVAHFLREGRAPEADRNVLLLARDGTERPVAELVSAIRDEGGGLAGLVLVLRDQTREREARRILKESEERYRLLVENTTDVIWVLDLATERFTFVSPSVFQLRGYTVEEAMRERLSDVLTPESYAETRAALDKRVAAFADGIETARVVFREVLQTRKGGGVISVECATILLADKLGRPTHLQGVSRDISDRKEAAAARLRYDLLAANTRDVILQIEADSGRILEANPAAWKTYGYSREELLAMSIFDLRPADSRKHVSRQMARAVQDGILFEAQHRRKDGSLFPVEVSSQVLPGAGQPQLISVIRDVSRRKNAEEALAREKQRLESAIEGGRLGAWEWNVQTGETVFNAVWAQLAGYTLAELAPVSIKTWERLAHPDDLKLSAEKLELHFSGATPLYACECRIRHKDGRWIWVADHGRVVSRTSDGKPLMMYGTHHDTTEMKQAEQELQEANERLEQARALLERRVTERTQELVEARQQLVNILDSMNDVFYSLDWDWRFVMVNAQAERYFGLAKEVLIGRTLWDVVPGLAGSLQGRQVMDAIRDRRPLIMQMNSFVRSGMVVEHHLYPGDTGLTIFMSDVTARVRAEEAVQANEERYRVLFNSTGDAVFVRPIIDGAPFAPFIEVNDAACSLFGYRREKMLGMSPCDLGGEEQGDQILELNRRILAGERVVFDAIGIAGDGRRIPLEVSSQAFALGGVHYGLEVLRDITARKRVEDELRRAKADADAASQSKSFFLANMSHEIRTPLNAILGYAQLLRRDTGLPENAKAKIGIINRSGEHLLELINDVLEMAKIESGRVVIESRHFDLYVLLDDVAAMFRLRAESRNLAFGLIRSGALPRFLVGDSGRIRQIIVNLCGNAVKFTEHGRVEIRASRQAEEGGGAATGR